MTEERKISKFVFCSPTTLIEKIHLNRPYFELPLAANRLGQKSYLFIGKINFSYKGPVEVVQSGYYERKWFKRFNLLIVLLRFIRSESPDNFIFFHMNLLLPLVIIANKFFNHKSKTRFMLKLDWSGNRIPEFGKLMFMRNILLSFQSHFLDNIIIENTCGYRALKTLPFLKRKRILIIPNSYASVFDTRETEAYRERKPIILVVSRISPEKGIEELISAFSFIKSEFENWSIKVIGPVENIQYFKFLRNLMESLNIQDKVLFVGPKFGNDIVKEMQEASIFSLPSLEESFGISRLEAMASGLPVLTSNAGCGEDFEKMGCLVYEVGDIPKLSIFLRNLISDKSLREQVCKNQKLNLRSYDEIILKILAPQQ